MTKFSTQKKTCPNPTEKQRFVLFEFQQFFFNATQPNKPNDKSARFRVSRKKNISLRKRKKKRQPNIAAHCTLLNGEEIQVRHEDRLDPK